jgi:deoxyribose-phosphate aldolase
LDLTSLNLDDTPERIDALCDKALAPGPGIAIRPAAVCVYPSFAGQCAARLRDSGIAVAVVVNFPGGDASIADVLAETKAALRDGANEIDVVLPYRDYLAGHREHAVDLVRAVSHVCREWDDPALLKVILETGALTDPEVITAAALDAVEAGAAFLKTSTGKLEPGATPEAAAALLEVAANVYELESRRIGVKVSGGVRTVADAALYLALADDAFAPDEAEPSNFRFGASGLLNDIVRVLTGAAGDHAPDRSGY